MKEKTYPSPQQKDNELPPGTVCQWCYSSIEKGEDYTKDSIYGYSHRDDNEFCVRTQEKVDIERKRLHGLIPAHLKRAGMDRIAAYFDRLRQMKEKG